MLPLLWGLSLQAILDFCPCVLIPVQAWRLTGRAAKSVLKHYLGAG
jgi:hypothetical protein